MTHLAVLTTASDATVLGISCGRCRRCGRDAGVGLPSDGAGTVEAETVQRVALA